MKKFLSVFGAIVFIGAAVAGVAYVVYRYLNKKQIECECDDECCFLDDDDDEDNEECIEEDILDKDAETTEE